MKNINLTSEAVFKKHNFELWDMTDLNKYQSNEDETIDGFHGGEVTYLKMLFI